MMIKDRRRDAADILRRLIICSNGMSHLLEVIDSEKVKLLAETWNALIVELQGQDLVIRRRLKLLGEVA